MRYSGTAARLLLAMTVGAFPGMAGSEMLSSSEAPRAEFCAGDYVCDEDGTWSIAHLGPSEHAMRLSLEVIEHAIRDGKVVSAQQPSPRLQQLARD
jgi:hypothetical protein